VASTIKIKRSGVSGKQPNTATLSVGELAINYKDQKLYSSNGTSVFQIGGSGSLTALTTKKLDSLVGTDTVVTGAQTVAASNYLQVVNASSTYATKAYVAANSYVKSTLANTNSYIATKVNSTTFNSALANTNSYIAAQASRITLVNTNLTATNTAIRGLFSTYAPLANPTFTGTVTTANISTTGKVSVSQSSYTPSNAGVLNAAIYTSGGYGGGITLNDTGIGSIWMQDAGTVMGLGIGTTSGVSGAMYLKSSGVGIGTTSPSGKFHVSGGRSYFTASSEQYGIALKYNASTSGVWLGSPGTDAFTVSTEGGTERMRIDSSGRIGFGVTPSTGASFQVKAIASGTADGRVEINKYLGTAASPSESQDWPSPALGIRTFQDYAKDTMLSFGYSNDAYYKTDDSVWNFRLNGLANATTSSSSTHLDLGGPGVFFINSSYTQAAGSLRAPIFYDSENTAFVCDPTGRSNLTYITNGPVAGSTTTGNQVGLEIKNNGGTGDGNVAAMSFHCAGAYGMHMHLRPDAYFGIGGWSATSWRWYVYMPSGDMTAAGNVTAYSDPRLKTDIINIESPLEKLKKLNGVRFKWIESSIIGHPGEYDYGILSSDVEKVMPELVIDSMHESPDGDKYKTVAYDKLSALLIEGMKEQQKQIEELLNRIKVLEQK
jgi:hypothetical protein